MTDLFPSINSAGISLIKSFESCSLTAYQDQGGKWTIGWGKTSDVTPEMTCTQQQADEWLIDDVNRVAAYVVLSCPSLNPNQVAACTSLAYNVGIGNFHNSTLLKCLRSNDLPGASAQFLVWIKIKGIPDSGLERRRQAEQVLFNTPI